MKDDLDLSQEQLSLLLPGHIIRDVLDINDEHKTPAAASSFSLADLLETAQLQQDMQKELGRLTRVSLFAELQGQQIVDQLQREVCRLQSQTI